MQCGQEVQVRFRTLLLDGTPLEDYLEKGEPVRLKVGDTASVIPGVANYTMGMRLGAERQVTLLPEMAYDAPGFRRKGAPLGSAVMLRLKLLGVKEDKVLAAAKDYNLFNIIQASSRKQAWCGEEVSVLVHNVSGRNVQEKLPAAEGYTTYFTVGARSVPLWLEQAVVGDGNFKPLGLGGYRGVKLTDDMTESKEFLAWEGAGVLKTDAGKDAVLRVQLVSVGDEKIEVQDSEAEKSAAEKEEGWTHDEPQEKADDTAPKMKKETAPAPAE